MDSNTVLERLLLASDKVLREAITDMPRWHSLCASACKEAVISRNESKRIISQQGVSTRRSVSHNVLRLYRGLSEEFSTYQVILVPDYTTAVRQNAYFYPWLLRFVW